MGKHHSFSARLGSCVGITLTSLISLLIALGELHGASCSPTTQTGSQAFVAQDLPEPIPAGRNSGGDPDTLFGAATIFSSVPQSSSASVSVCIDDSVPQFLKVTISPGAAAPIVLWDHERLLNQNGQVVTHIEAVANVPAADTYTVKVFDDRVPAGLTGSVGTFNACTLTLNPVNPGHIGPPIVNLYADAAHNAVPPSIEVGQPLTLFATAIGNPSSYKIERLGIKITEIVELDPLHPDPAHPLQVYEQHYSGIGPQLYQSDDVMQLPSSTTGVSLTYIPPDLPPGLYFITATAWDSAGFSRTVATILSVNRSFGFLNVVNLARQVNTDCDESVITCNSQNGDFGFPCNTTNFSATLNLINNTEDDFGNLRVRLLDVAGGAYLDQVNFTPPAIQDLNQGFVGPVTPLPGCSAQEVQICGVIPKPDQTDCDFGVGHQVFAVLEECPGSAAECGPNSDLWTAIDSIKVTEGEWVQVAGFAGPGGGANQDRRGVSGGHNPFRLNSVTITGPTTVAASTQVQYRANAILKNSTGNTKTLNNVAARWTASLFTINPTTGLFTAGNVATATPVTIAATYRFARVTRRGILNIVVTPPAALAAEGAAATSSRSASASSAEMSRELNLESNYAFGEVSPQIAIPADVIPEARASKRRHKTKRPVATISGSPATIREGGAAIFRVSARRANRSRPLTIKYALRGSAVLNTHYVVCGNPGQVTIPAGASSATIILNALANDLNGGREVATLTLRPGRGYKLSRQRTKSVTIGNLPPPACP